MPFSPRRLPTRGTVFRILTIGSAVVVVLGVAVAIWLYVESIRTFEVRRVSLPTRSRSIAYAFGSASPSACA